MSKVEEYKEDASTSPIAIKREASTSSLSEHSRDGTSFSFSRVTAFSLPRIVGPSTKNVPGPRAVAEKVKMTKLSPKVSSHGQRDSALRHARRTNEKRGKDDSIGKDDSSSRASSRGAHFFIVKTSFEGSHPGELSVVKGDKVFLFVDRENEKMVFVRTVHGDEGWMPRDLLYDPNEAIGMLDIGAREGEAITDSERDAKDLLELFEEKVKLLSPATRDTAWNRSLAGAYHAHVESILHNMAGLEAVLSGGSSKKMFSQYMRRRESNLEALIYVCTRYSFLWICEAFFFDSSCFCCPFHPSDIYLLEVNLLDCTSHTITSMMSLVSA